MEEGTSFEKLWNRFADFAVPEGQLPTRCAYADEFSKWAEELCAKSARDASIVSINQAKLMLLDKYFEWRGAVPRPHRNRIGQTGHRCIFQVFAQAYEKLKVVEIALTPPMLFTPAPPPSIEGIFIGELEKR